MVSDGAMVVQKVILGKMEYHKATSIFDGRILLLKAYNQLTGIKRSIRTLDRRIHELTQAGLLKRWPRKRNAGILGRIYTSAGSAVTKAGLKALKRYGVDPYPIINKIKRFIREGKEKTRQESSQRVREGSGCQIGEILGKELEKLKPS